MKFAITVLIFVLLATPAKGQHPAKDQALHDQFYSKWLMPIPRDRTGQRINSCCSRHDCYATSFKLINGAWFARQRETGQFIAVPEQRLEHNQPDPRESPDGFGHLCANPTGMVYCAVLGGQG